MRTPITIPEFPHGGEPLRLGEWAVEPGDTVEVGETLAEVICPGLAIDLCASVTGVIAELTRQPEQAVTPGEIVGWIETE